MNPKNRALLLVILLAALTGAAVWGVVWYRGRPVPTARLLKRLPTRDALVIYVDFAELRRGGALQSLDAGKVEEDPDYQSFARRIGLNWKTDLDSVLLAAAPTGNYMFVKGRFDWKSLRDYTASVGGDCSNALCRTTGSTPARRISFFPVQPRLMALAVSTDPSAALELQSTRSGPDSEVPTAPVWVSVPSSMLRASTNLPAGTRMFAHSVEQAESVLLTFGPDGSRIAARLEVRCRDEHDALQVAGQLAGATLTLKQMLEREHQQPGPGDLAGILAAGTFRSEGRTVYGYWPIDRAFVESLLNGGAG